MKLAFLQTADSEMIQQTTEKFYPFKRFDPRADIIRPRVLGEDRFDREVAEFRTDKAAQTLHDLADLMPGTQEASNDRDHGATIFHRILSRYDRDLTYKPHIDRVQILDSMPDKAAAYSMLGFGRDIDPLTFEQLTDGTLTAD